MKKFFVAVAAIAALLGLSSCGATEKHTGTVSAKYIENFAEHNLVVEIDGTTHHIEVEADVFARTAIGSTYTHTTSAWGEED